MKKSLTTNWSSFLLIFAFLILAHNDAHSQLKIGILVGSNFSSIKSEWNGGTSKISPGYFGYKFGLTSELGLDDKVKLDLSFYYNFKRAREIAHLGGLGASIDRDISYTLGMFSISALVNIGISKDNNFSLIWGGVYYNSISVKGSGSVAQQGPNPSWQTIDNSNIRDYLNKTSGVALQLGLEKSLFNKSKEINLKGFVSLTKTPTIELQLEFLKIFSSKKN